MFLRFRRIIPAVLKPTCRHTRLQHRSMATRMEPSKVRYGFVEEVERLDYYVRGGYHPVMIGDEFCAGPRRRQLVALKISTAGSVGRTHEMQTLSQLARAESRLPGKAIVQNLLDSFTFSGPNGTHQCLVTDAARTSIHEAKEAPYHRLLQLPAAQAITSQLILGLQFIHSQGIVHGDLHLANILLRLPPDMQGMTLEQLRDRTGEPAKEQVVCEDGALLDHGVPLEVIVPLWLGIDSDKIFLVDSAIMIADFGEAFDPRVTPQFAAHTPPLLAPSESCFAEPGELDESLSFSADIWTLACTIWDIFGSRPPFEAFPVTLDEVTIEHVEMLGKLPDRWWRKWAERRNWFDEDGQKNVKESLCQWYSNSSRDWDQRFRDYIQHPRQRRKFDFSEEKAFCDMIKSMLVLEPSKRATIDEVVRCEWMLRWDLPELQRMDAMLKSS
ncbi:predicted protein [Uncinocarpus reesii 1704]|uniref:non-specific serine/threonine protein kinase n=1 Tax=Uncinocarpus reesii (strain UAMH 1704) TaxID=336963 RepID=C4JFN5_UNCRE|nr:uncharacterized protein UREG_02369 [Uncinocarpus reesii 1704]EEP77520.1 predicted protein [Uncinocarpus reesii 1704]